MRLFPSVKWVREQRESRRDEIWQRRKPTNVNKTKRRSHIVGGVSFDTYRPTHPLISLSIRAPPPIAHSSYSLISLISSPTHTQSPTIHITPPMIRTILLLALAILSVLSPVSGLYFHIVEGTRKCFIEEVPEDVLVMGKYTSPDFSRININPTTGMVDTENYAAIRATVMDPRNELILTHDTVAEGRFGFTSVVGGEHIICLATNTSSWYGQSRTFVRTHSHTHSHTRQQRETRGSSVRGQRPITLIGIQSDFLLSMLSG